MTIDSLVKVVPPPEAPFEAFDGPWEPVEAALGTALPADYKDFVRLYGSGYFMDFLGVSVPGSRNPNVRLESAVRADCDSVRALEEFSYPLWPAPGGLIPFAQTDNGDYIFWLPDGAPEDWKVIVWDRGLLGFETFGCGLTDFLAGLAMGDILPKEFPDDLLPCERLFSPNGPVRSGAAGDAPGVSVNLTWQLGALSGVSQLRLRTARRA